MSPSTSNAVRRALTLLQWIWAIAVGLVFTWHMSMMPVLNPEVMRPVILAYALVCSPISVAVILVLAFSGWVSASEGLEPAYAAFMIAGLFLGAGWFQWFYVGPRVLILWNQLRRSKRGSDQAAGD